MTESSNRARQTRVSFDDEDSVVHYLADAPKPAPALEAGP